MKHPLFVKTALGCIAGIFLVLAADGMYQRVTNQEKYKVDTRGLSIVVQPDWMPTELADGLKLPDGVLGKYSVFESELVSTIGKAYAANPWVREVRGIRREYPDRIRVALDIRRPVACVRVGAWYYMVDEEGVRLPGIFEERPVVAGHLLAFIRGVRTPPCAAGVPWNDRSVAVGAYLARQVLDSPVMAPLKITTVDVGDIPSVGAVQSGGCSLLTENHTEIRWEGLDTRYSSREWCDSRMEILSNHLVSDGLLKRHPGLRDILRIIVPRFGVPTIVKR
ncbi:MAG: hypothetical protein QF752_12315 [Planctomycetota bacterium]|jgi:hypothetical protein|nr:hypothetical protein [Planctomycetota bacterium]